MKMDREIKTTPGIGPSTCRRNLNVENAADQLNIATDDLADAIGNLESTLEPLLGPERPCDIGSEREQGESQVGERVLAQANRIRLYAARIHELIDRL